MESIFYCTFIDYEQSPLFLRGDFHTSLRSIALLSLRKNGDYLQSIRLKFILKSRFSHALLNMYVSCSTKRGERTWQSLTCHIENVFEHQKAFSLQIEARVNQRRMIQKKNSVLIRKKRMRIEGNRKNHELSRKLGYEITHGCAMKRRCTSTSN